MTVLSLWQKKNIIFFEEVKLENKTLLTLI
jgi:hypothetical protein